MDITENPNENTGDGEIYLDSAATSRVCPDALSALLAAAQEYANPSSLHRAGRRAAKLLADARKTLSEACCCEPEEIIFTSSGTEANNLALLGAARANIRYSKRIISTDSEHPSVENALKELEKEGFEVFRLSTKRGVPDYTRLSSLLKEKTSLVAVMHVNNETGAVYDIPKIHSLIDASGSGALLFSDNVQGFIKEDSITSYCDMMSASAHKIGGIKGSALLYVKKGTKLKNLIYGGEQERSIRPGTENLPGICAFAAAAKAFAAHDNEYVKNLYSYLCEMLSHLPYVTLNIPEKASPYILSVSLGIIKSEVALNALSSEEIYISAGSACSSHKRNTRVPEAFGLSGKALESSVRISLSHDVTKPQIEKFVQILSQCAERYGRIGK
ncbi:MAG TPA: aminotransferase class V-fold PLP-dependent enzyme [Bacillota bacterium]|nr:aminotransferase class V-fold PLP-dependent enzyme [Bacillota bacterium]